MNPRFFSLLICELVLSGAALDSASTIQIKLPTPAGLQRCPPDDPVGAQEEGVAGKLHADYLGCFQSVQRVPAPGVATSAQMPVEYAFAFALRDSNYKAADLAGMLATVRQQWKDFDPLGAGLKDDYIARLNDMIASNGTLSPATLVSVKPVLFAIDQGKENYYTVTSIRTYTVAANGQKITQTKVSADAVAMQGSRIVRLTIQRTLSDPADVAQVRGEIAAWALAITQRAPPSAQ